VIVIYTKADKKKKRPVGTIIKVTNIFKDWDFVKEYFGKFPPDRNKKTRINLKDLK
jgi:hypothetical protein